MRNLITGYRLFCCLAYSLLATSCIKKEQVVPAMADFSFSYESLNQTIPVKITIQNNSLAAESYQWTFEGAEPSSSTAKNPGTLLYKEAGHYKIILEASNADGTSRITQSVDIHDVVHLDFTAEPIINLFAPAELHIQNLSVGGINYQWSFQGASPEQSSEEQPGTIRYESPGDYHITLQVFNGSKTFEKTQQIRIDPELSADFSIQPMLGHEDYEVPFTALLEVQGQSILNYQWTAIGGLIKDPTAPQTEIHFSQAGEYSISLKADNSKHEKTVVKHLKLKPNSNLYSFPNIKLGINTAHKNIGSFYSTRLQKVFNTRQIDQSNGGLIDITFFGLNSNFTQNSFISADQVQQYTFEAIPNAQGCTWINNPAAHGIHIDNRLFDEMQDDSWLESLNFTGQQQHPAYFNNSQSPHFVVFKHASGYKGLVRVRAFQQEGLEDSHIIVDIKVQKK